MDDFVEEPPMKIIYDIILITWTWWLGMLIILQERILVLKTWHKKKSIWKLKK